MSSAARSLLILGLGNILLGDDGAGIVAVEQLAHRYDAPDGVRVLDGGTLGLSLLPYLADAERAILVDAVQADAPPGSLVRLEGDDVARASVQRLSVHQIGVADLLDGARLLGQLPRPLILIGVVPESIELRVGLSAPVAAAVPGLVGRVIAEAARLGHPFKERSPCVSAFPAG